MKINENNNLKEKIGADANNSMSKGSIKKTNSIKSNKSNNSNKSNKSNLNKSIQSNKSNQSKKSSQSNNSNQSKKSNIYLKKDSYTKDNFKKYNQKINIDEDNSIVNKLGSYHQITKKLQNNKTVKQNGERNRDNNCNYTAQDINKNNYTNMSESKSFINNTLPNPGIVAEDNYFYNDSINQSFKPNKPNKLSSQNIPRNELKKIILNNRKNIGLEVVRSDKNLKVKKIRENVNPLNGKIFHNMSELDFITSKIHENQYQIYFNLLYRASEDNDKSFTFHKKCDSNQTTLILLETKKGCRFGGFTNRTWRGGDIEKNDNDAFLFCLNKMKIYNLVRGNKAIGCSPKLGPFFIGGFKIFDNSLSKGGCTFVKGLNYEMGRDFELNNGEEYFKIKELEVYEIKIA